MKIVILQYLSFMLPLLVILNLIPGSFSQLDTLTDNTTADAISPPPPLDLSEPLPQLDTTTTNNVTASTVSPLPTPPTTTTQPASTPLPSSDFFSQSSLKNLSNNNGSSITPTIYSPPPSQSNSNSVYALWSDNSTGNFDVMLAKSNDGGVNFDEPINLSDNIGSSITPTIYSPPPSQSNSNSVYALWSDNSTGNFDVMLAKSNDGGVNFDEPINLSDNIGSSITPTIYSPPPSQSNSNSVYALWSDNSTGNFDVMLAKSNDGGVNFDEPINLSDNIGSSITPTIYSPPPSQSNSNSVYALWSDNSTGNFDVMLAKSNDGGVNFDEPINISQNPGSSFIEKDSLVFSSDKKSLYVVWVDDSLGRADIYFKKISNNDNGTITFGDTINLSNNFDITFSALPNGLIFSSNPEIEIVDDKVNVIWEQHSIIGNREIVNLFSKNTNDTGGTFSRPIDLSSTLGLSLNPNLAIAGDFVFLIWQNNAPIGFDTFDIFAKISNDKGKSFSKSIDLSGTRNPSVNPDVALLNDGGAGIVWQELTPIGKDEIFFKKIVVDNLPAVEEKEEEQQEGLQNDTSLPEEDNNTSLGDLSELLN